MKKWRIALAFLMASLLMLTSGCLLMLTPKKKTTNKSSDKKTGQKEKSDRKSSEDGVVEMEKEFGTYEIKNGWVEVDSQSMAPDIFTYCVEGNENSKTPPNNIVVRHDKNQYSKDQHVDFSAAILQQIHGQAASYNGTAAMTEYGRFGENMCYRFDMDCEELDLIQWYVIGDHEYVMFSITIVDEDAAEDDDCIDMAEDSVNSFVWDD